MYLRATFLVLSTIALLGYSPEASAQYVSNGYGQGQTVVRPIVGQVTRYGTPRYGVRYNGNVARYGTRRAGVYANGNSVRIGTPRWGVQFGNGNLQVGRLNRRW